MLTESIIGGQVLTWPALYIWVMQSKQRYLPVFQKQPNRLKSPNRIKRNSGIAGSQTEHIDGSANRKNAKPYLNPQLSLHTGISIAIVTTMSLRILRSRAFSVASSKRFLCTNAASAPQPSPPSAASPSRWNFLKYAVVGAITGTTALAGYASYGSFLILFHFSHLLSLFSFFFISIFTVAIPRSQLMDSIFVRVCVVFLTF